MSTHTEGGGREKEGREGGRGRDHCSYGASYHLSEVLHPTERQVAVLSKNGVGMEVGAG